MDTKQCSRKAILLAFLVFVLGIALGSSGTYVVTKHKLAPRRDPAAKTMAMFTKNMDLTEEQEAQIEKILNETRARYLQIHAQVVEPEYEKVRQESRERIRQLLTPEQRPKFEDLLQRMDAERRKQNMDAEHQKREAEEHVR
jgi:Spy/CpxP family protein refolding chaperone